MNKIVLLAFSFLISTQTQASDLFVELDVSSSHNSNIFLESDGEIVATSSGEMLSGSQTNIGLSADTELFNGKNSDLKVLADLMVEKYDYQELDSRVLYAELPYSYYLDSWRFRVSPSFLSFNIAGENALSYQAIKLDATKNFGNFKAGLSFKNTVKTSQNEAYDIYNGSATELQAMFSGRLFDGFFNAQLGQIDNAYDESLLGDLSNTNTYVSASYRFSIKDYSGRFYAKLRDVDYAQDLYTGEQRNDQNWRLSFTNNYKLSANTSIYLTTSYVDNDSNFEENNYQQWVNGLGIKFHL